MFDWKKKSVLVTGANGFIGSWLTEMLVKEGADITVLIKPGDPIGLDSLKHLTESIKVFYGDVRDFKKMEEAVKEKDIIFHLAAITQVLYGVKNPVETVEVDINGTLNILESIRKAESNAFLVFSSTDKVYGEPLYLPINEEHRLDSKSPYDAAKLGADRLVRAYHNTYGLKCSISRWSNTIGGRDSNILRAVPDFIRALLTGKDPVIRGHGRHLRDYIYVDDSITGIMKLAENQPVSNGEAFNFGTEKPTTVIEICEMIISAMNMSDRHKPIILNKTSKAEIEKQYLTNKKAMEKLGWRPKTTIETALEKTISWYKKNPWWWDVVDRVSQYYGII